MNDATLWIENDNIQSWPEGNKSGIRFERYKISIDLRVTTLELSLKVA